TGAGEVIALAADGERKRFEAGRADPERQHRVVSHEEYGAAVDPAGETDADWSVRCPLPQPLADLRVESADVGPADGLDVRAQGVLLRGEKTAIRRVRVGAADESDFGDEVGRHHPRVRRLELVRQTLGGEVPVNGVDAGGHNQGGPGGALGDEVTQR